MIDFRAFQRPQRYIGNEWNVVKKSHGGKIKICLSYPDLYEIGMSNLGLRIIYSLLNEYPEVVCERVFMPGLDLVKFLKEKNKKLFSLETKTALCDFEILGFHLGCELGATNFLNILSLGGIALFAKERKKMIVMGGGAANPEPLADFIDIFCLGEFEEVSDKFVYILKKCNDKQSRLRAFAELEGLYVPAFYSAGLKNGKYFFQKKYPYAKFPLSRVYVKNIDKAYYPYKWLTPHTQIIHDRVPIEIARGCPNRCTFCQARAFYHPYREKKVSTIRNIMEKIYKNSGYENFSLLSLSASDYSCIEELIDTSYDYFQGKKVGLALPSLRVDDLLGKLYKKISSFKKTSLTVALEAARNPLRESLNKKIDINKLFEAAKVIRSLGMKHIKIYFMFGLLQEEEEDLTAIGKFLQKLSTGGLPINASINAFIPKPFSLWEDVEMTEETVLAAKKNVILKSIPRRKNIKISFSFLKRSILEAVISRADRKFSSVIHRAYINGAKFDGCTENFSWNIWKEAMEAEGIDYRFYLKTKQNNSPWSFIESRGHSA